MTMSSSLYLADGLLTARHRRRLTASQLKSAVTKGILSEKTPTSPMPARPATKRPQRGAAAPQVTQVESAPAHPHQSLITEVSEIQVALLAKSADYVMTREDLTQIDTEMQQLREKLRKCQSDLAQYVEKLPGGRQQAVSKMADPVDGEVQLPAWLWTYYTQDQLVQRVVKECKAAGHDKQQMYRTLLEQLLIDREKQRADTLKTLQDHPSIPVLPELPAVPTDWTKDLGDGYTLVPMDQMTLNGMFLPKLPVKLPITKWAVLGPDRKGLQSEGGGVFCYDSPDEAARDVDYLKGMIADSKK